MFSFLNCFTETVRKPRILDCEKQGIENHYSKSLGKFQERAEHHIYKSIKENIHIRHMEGW